MQIKRLKRRMSGWEINIWVRAMRSVVLGVDPKTACRTANVCTRRLSPPRVSWLEKTQSADK